ncbi:TPA: hypothetical protein NI671_004637 [Pseudomonas aeruginosa]|uniref:hypothetical protein n=1 Tax=Pseudomonas aeruginosa TaxID=287 RepID=UPI00163D0E77|nr:hypothetical protein [Pseudomonas aeruginosa]WMX09225.1 hypothetical protein RG643_04905 [Pseudomonas aeruginosa]HCF4410692.1 hypothetical protein [Pseudomonas aeruginosa]HCF9455724.1 hypothetical protein [Pseudomonas aeruginosa]HCF9462458.1 hypothetical protein [Pseudomonas aeruginosa]HCF9481525.1 hypothetical protein [Pseudomonas aeruginosa]
MSEVKKISPVGNIYGWEESQFGEFVLSQDYDDLAEEAQALREEVAALRAKLAMAEDAAAKGDAARQQCGGMEMEIQELRENAAKLAAFAQEIISGALLDEIDRLSDELSACTEHPGGCGYWREAAKRRAEERDRLRAENDRLRQGMKGDYDIDAWLDWLKEKERIKAENDALRGALQAVEAEVDGNLRPLTRDLVNMVSGLKNGSHPNDIYEHCDEIERIIGAALEGDKP